MSLGKHLVNDLINQKLNPSVFSFIDNNGLVNSRPLESNAENSILWTVELFVIMRKKGYDTTVIEEVINKNITKMHLGNGVYKQNPSFKHPKDDDTKEAYMSHDQITALIVFWKATNQVHKIQELMSAFRFGMFYDNKDNKLRRLHRPDNLIYWHFMSGNEFVLLLLPLLYLLKCITFITKYKGKSKKTDGEILYYIQQYVSGDLYSPINWFCNMRIEDRFGNWNNVFATYFKHDNHPIRQLMK